MKKIIFSLAVVLGLASCNSWDDEQTQNYGDGPAITIDLTTTADSSFTFTVNPAQGTNYYTYTVVEGTEAEEVEDFVVGHISTNADGKAVISFPDYWFGSYVYTDEAATAGAGWYNLILPGTVFTLQ